jgi:hypothetical protein
MLPWTRRTRNGAGAERGNSSRQHKSVLSIACDPEALVVFTFRMGILDIRGVADGDGTWRGSLGRTPSRGNPVPC